MQCSAMHLYNLYYVTSKYMLVASSQKICPAWCIIVVLTKVKILLGA